MIEKLNHLTVGSASLVVKFIETHSLKDGVDCDTYSFADNSSRDLAIITVQEGFKTHSSIFIRHKDYRWLNGRRRHTYGS